MVIAGSSSRCRWCILLCDAATRATLAELHRRVAVAGVRARPRAGRSSRARSSRIGFIELLINLFVLWAFVPTLERFWGTARFYRFVAITSIVGVLAGILAGLATGADVPIYRPVAVHPRVDRRVRRHLRAPAGAVLRRAAADRPPADVRIHRGPGRWSRCSAGSGSIGAAFAGALHRRRDHDVEAVEPGARAGSVAHRAHAPAKLSVIEGGAKPKPQARRAARASTDPRAASGNRPVVVPSPLMEEGDPQFESGTGLTTLFEGEWATVRRLRKGKLVVVSGAGSGQGDRDLKPRVTGGRSIISDLVVAGQGGLGHALRGLGARRRLSPARSELAQRHLRRRPARPRGRTCARARCSASATRTSSSSRLQDVVEIELSKKDRFDMMLGASPAMREIFAHLEKVAPSRADVPHHRRDRHRQGDGRARAAQRVARARTSRSSCSTAARSRAS